MKPTVKFATGSGKRRHHWLTSVKVIAALGNVSPDPFTRELNVLVHTDKPIFTRKDMNRAQQQANLRFVKEVFGENVPAELTLIDIVILATSNIGHMTDEEFSGGFDEYAAALAATAARQGAGVN